MDTLNQRLLEVALEWWPVGVVAVSAAVFLYLAYYVLFRTRRAQFSEDHILRHLLMLVIIGAWIVVGILAMPVSDATHGQLLGFLGILISAAIALSSTTLLGNIMAGVMIRSVRSFRPGDFVRVGDHFGRVSELGFMHTEIQTADRDLTTLPNLFLVQNPVSVVRSCGTVVSANLSLGYDVPRSRVKELLKAAADEAGLTEPFVQVLDLGNDSITYRIAGLLEDVKILLTARSNLRGKVVDALHAAGIEIVSPRFINQRVFPREETFLSVEPSTDQPETREERNPEEVIFDKAEKAETREQIAETLRQVEERLVKLETDLKAATTDEERAALEKRTKRFRRLRDQLAATLAPGPKEA